MQGFTVSPSIQDTRVLISTLKKFHSKNTIIIYLFIFGFLGNGIYEALPFNVTNWHPNNTQSYRILFYSSNPSSYLAYNNVEFKCGFPAQKGNEGKINRS